MEKKRIENNIYVIPACPLRSQRVKKWESESIPSKLDSRIRENDMTTVKKTPVIGVFSIISSDMFSSFHRSRQ
jgi:hypothetical protein